METQAFCALTCFIVRVLVVLGIGFAIGHTVGAARNHSAIHRPTTNSRAGSTPQQVDRGAHSSLNDSRSSSASEWIADARPGFCAATSSAGTEFCDLNAAQGSWGVSASAASTLNRTVEICLQKCAQCPRCNYITVNPSIRDCSWYHSCDLQRLKTKHEGFLSGRAQVARQQLRQQIARRPSVVLFMHLEKTGGTMARGAFISRGWNATSYGMSDKPSEWGRGNIFRNVYARLVHGETRIFVERHWHISWDAPLRMKRVVQAVRRRTGMEVRYRSFTVLRSPINLAISQYYYWHHHLVSRLSLPPDHAYHTGELFYRLSPELLLHRDTFRLFGASRVSGFEFIPLRERKTPGTGQQLTRCPHTLLTTASVHSPRGACAPCVCGAYTGMGVFIDLAVARNSSRATCNDVRFRSACEAFAEAVSRSEHARQTTCSGAQSSTRSLHLCGHRESWLRGAALAAASWVAAERVASYADAIERAVIEGCEVLIARAMGRLAALSHIFFMDVEKLSLTHALEMAESGAALRDQTRRGGGAGHASTPRVNVGAYSLTDVRLPMRQAARHNKCSQRFYGEALATFASAAFTFESLAEVNAPVVDIDTVLKGLYHL